MISFNRRQALLGAAATAGMAAVSPALAFAPQSADQAPGFYRRKVGDIQITVVNDGVGRAPIPDGFVKNATKDEVNAALQAASVERDIFAGPYNPMLINNGKQLALMDTGTGPGGLAGSKGLNGRLMINLAAAGVDPASIDAVIITHYHGDHINGLIKADGSLAFPNAEILVPEAEHKFWTDAGEESRAKDPRVVGGFANAKKVLNAEVLKRIKTYQPGKEVISGVTAMATPGHTPGHTSHVVSSGKDSIFIQADVTNVPYLFARNPGWHLMFDVDPVVAEATRRKVYDMLVADKMLMQGFHYPFPAIATIEKSGNGYRETLINWSPTI